MGSERVFGPMGTTVVVFAIIVVAGLAGMTRLLLRGMERVPIESIKAHAQAGRGGVSVGLEVRAPRHGRLPETSSAMQCDPSRWAG
jgi:hypothetical protein